MRPKKGFLLILFMAFTACASNNNSTSTPSGSQDGAPQASSKNFTETIQSASGEKCAIDEKRICEEGGPGVSNDPFGTANSDDVRDRIAAGDDTGGRSSSISTFRYATSLLQGERPVNVWCGMRMANRTVTYAQLATSGTPTDTDIAKLRAGGFCSN
jgi:hypothetical protein